MHHFECQHIDHHLTMVVPKVHIYNNINRNQKLMKIIIGYLKY